MTSRRTATRLLAVTFVGLLAIGCPDEGDTGPSGADAGGNDTSQPDVSNVECTVPEDCTNAGLEPGACQELACSDTGRCQVRAKTDGDACEDGDLCTSNDTCNSGSCDPGSATDCDDGIACTSDSCEAAAGCVHEPDNTPCDDGVLCTADLCDLDDGCINPTDPLACDDGIACTIDVCNDDGTCTSTQDDSRCEDGIECTVDVCTTTVGCIQTLDDGPCDDGVACTVDTCAADGGCGNTPDPGACDDFDDCTADLCDPVEGCKNELASCGNAVCDCGETKETCPGDCQGTGPTLDLDDTADGTGFVGTYTEGDAPLLIAENAVAGDDDGVITELTADLLNALSGELERVTVDVGASGLVASTSGSTLTVTGDADLATWQTVIRTLAYVNTDEDAASNPRLVEVTLTDGDGLTSEVAVANVGMVSVNDAAVVDLNGDGDGIDVALTYEAGIGTMDVAPDALVTDVDHLTLATLSITLSGTLDSDETIAVDAGDTGIGVTTIGSGILLTGPASPEAFQAVVRTLTYENEAGVAATTGERTIEVSAFDGTDAGSVATASITIIEPQLQPVVALDGMPGAAVPTLSFTEGDPALALATEASLTDADSAQIEQLLVVLTDAPDDEEALAATASGAVTVSWSDAEKTLTLQGPAPVAEMLATLQSLTYAHAGEAPTAGTRTLTATGFDTDGAGPDDVVLIELVAVNDLPMADLNGAEPGNDAAATYTENDGAMMIWPALTLTDADHEELATVTVSLSGLADPTEFVMAGSSNGDITIDVSQPGLIVLNGPATAAEFETVLRAMTYTHQSDTPTAGDRLVSVIPNDGVENGLPAVLTLTVVPVNDAPVVESAVTTFAWTEGDEPLALGGSLTVSDLDHESIESMTITLAGHVDDAETLTVDAGASGITVDSDGTTITLTGPGSAAAFDAVLGTLEYDNTGDPPTVGDRTVTLTGTDAVETGAPLVLTVSVGVLNASPNLDLDDTADGVDSAAMWVEQGGPVLVAEHAALTDDSTLVLLTIEPQDGDEAGVLAIGNAQGLTVATEGASLTLSGDAAPVTWQEALATVTFDEPGMNPSAAARIYTVTVTDAFGATAEATLTVTPSLVNDAPAATDDAYATTGNQHITVDALAGVLANDTDVEGTTLTAGNAVSASGAVVTLEADGSFVYTPPPGFLGDDTFTYELSDGGDPAQTAEATVTITVTGPVVWFVDNTLGTPSGTGTSLAPFDTLADAGAGTSGPGDTIRIIRQPGLSTVAASAGQTEGFVLQANQRLEGVGVDRPVIANPAGPAITLADGVVVTHLSVDSTSGPAIVGASVGAELSDLFVNGGAAGVMVTDAGVVTITGLTVGGIAPTGIALHVDGGTSLTATGLNITGNTLRAVDIQGVDTIVLGGDIDVTGGGVVITNGTLDVDFGTLNVVGQTGLGIFGSTGTVDVVDANIQVSGDTFAVDLNAPVVVTFDSQTADVIEASAGADGLLALNATLAGTFQLTTVDAAAGLSLIDTPGTKVFQTLSVSSIEGAIIDNAGTVDVQDAAASVQATAGDVVLRLRDTDTSLTGFAFAQVSCAGCASGVELADLTDPVTITAATLGGMPLGAVSITGCSATTTFGSLDVAGDGIGLAAENNPGDVVIQGGSIVHNDGNHHPGIRVTAIGSLSVAGVAGDRFLIGNVGTDETPGFVPRALVVDGANNVTLDEVAIDAVGNAPTLGGQDAVYLRNVTGTISVRRSQIGATDVADEIPAGDGIRIEAETAAPQQILLGHADDPMGLVISGGFYGVVLDLRAPGATTDVQITQTHFEDWGSDAGDGAGLFVNALDGFGQPTPGGSDVVMPNVTVSDCSFDASLFTDLGSAIVIAVGDFASPADLAVSLDQVTVDAGDHGVFVSVYGDTGTESFVSADLSGVNVSGITDDALRVQLAGANNASTVHVRVDDSQLSGDQGAVFRNSAMGSLTGLLTGSIVTGVTTGLNLDAGTMTGGLTRFNVFGVELAGTTPVRLDSGSASLVLGVVATSPLVGTTVTTAADVATALNSNGGNVVLGNPLTAGNFTLAGTGGVSLIDSTDPVFDGPTLDMRAP